MVFGRKKKNSETMYGRRRVSYAPDLDSLRGLPFNDEEDDAAILNARKSMLSTPTNEMSRTFTQRRKSRQNMGGYTSLFPRKLVPPLGFYREVDKYTQLKAKFEGDYDKLEALEDMWKDFKKYQIRERFRWPPKLFFGKFFWTTGYYADYQKRHRPTHLRKPGGDSSEEEFIDPSGQYMIASKDGDIDVDEFQRYRLAKMTDPNRMRRYTRHDIRPIEEEIDDGLKDGMYKGFVRNTKKVGDYDGQNGAGKGQGDTDTKRDSQGAKMNANESVAPGVYSGLGEKKNRKSRRSSKEAGGKRDGMENDDVGSEIGSRFGNASSKSRKPRKSTKSRGREGGRRDRGARSVSSGKSH